MPVEQKSAAMYLVTGSTGFIGSHICRALVSLGVPVRAFHRASSSLAGLDGLQVDHAIGDITQPATLEPAMQGVEVVFHTAALLGRHYNPTRMFPVTVEGTRALLQAALLAGVRRVVHTSSVAALGVPGEAPPSPSAYIDERHTWNYPPRRWPYGYTKYLAELEVQRFVAQGLDVVIVNPAVVLGPGDLNRVSGDAVLRVARGQIPVSAPGGLTIIHIDDVVQGHLAALKRGRTGERYILGGENLSHHQFLTLAAQVTGGRPPLFSVPARLVRGLSALLSTTAAWLPLPFSSGLLTLAGHYFYYNTGKSRRELGLAEPAPTRQAIADAFEWYRSHSYI